MYATDYACILTNVVVTDEAREVTFSGNHLGGRTNDDVTIVHVLNSMTPFMVRQIFRTFPNTIELSYESSKLQTINVPSTVQLDRLILYGNNITVIENSRFRGQTRLESIRAIGNNIQTIEENAFEGLSRLKSLTLIENEIRTLARKTFHTLTSLESLDLMGNSITRLDADHFSMNRNLRVLYLVANQINAISRNFADSLRTTLNYINLSSNSCIDRAFFLDSESDWFLMTQALQLCFNNHDKTSGSRQRISFVFEGDLDILDEFGNVITQI